MLVRDTPGDGITVAAEHAPTGSILLPDSRPPWDARAGHLYRVVGCETLWTGRMHLFLEPIHR
jgi:hypothetical protein